jgi:hypothetical protein
MADTKTTKATLVKGDSAATPAPAPVTKPERPNDEEYKANLAKAEKELKAAEEKMVSDIQRSRRRLVFLWGNKDEICNTMNCRVATTAGAD